MVEDTAENFHAFTSNNLRVLLKQPSSSDSNRYHCHIILYNVAISNHPITSNPPNKHILTTPTRTTTLVWNSLILSKINPPNPPHPLPKRTPPSSRPPRQTPHHQIHRPGFATTLRHQCRQYHRNNRNGSPIAICSHLTTIRPNHLAIKPTTIKPSKTLNIKNTTLLRNLLPNPNPLQPPPRRPREPTNPLLRSPSLRLELFLSRLCLFRISRKQPSNIIKSFLSDIANIPQNLYSPLSKPLNIR